MKENNSALVALDLSKMDDILLNNIHKISQLLGLSKIYFTHISHLHPVPEDVAESYPKLAVSKKEDIKKELEAKLDNLTLPSSVESKIVVEEGHLLETLLKLLKSKKVDYLVMGRKKELEGSGAFAKKIAQKSPCSVFFVPESIIKTQFQNFLVPIDFSHHSELTLKKIEGFTTEKEPSIRCLHVYHVPIGYHKTGKSYEEFSEIMHKNAITEYKSFIKKNKFKEYPCDFMLKGNDHNADLIYQDALKQKADLIIMGSRGRSGSAAILLGSVAEKVTFINHEIPLLILKQKGENMGFLEALFKI
ncbi:universal stress protein [Echinicola jeungdonensis]|uniref:Universal stress protein n=1 Tax=Echinicola jeungdonensis TaxID=709343 RepID=A0ABV5J7J4_9BACT|nr:universal stress protein [Echinicola jeungdonensis]MDN3669282.1 universal stress protein [Echinicola jeungdonensis]